MTDALVNQECLVVLHSGGIVRLYSLQHIVAEVGLFFALFLLSLPSHFVWLCSVIGYWHHIVIISVCLSVCTVAKPYTLQQKCLNK